MKFSVGDRVLMKRTGEEGIITTFLSKQIIEVEVGDVKFPVYADELDHPYLKWFTDPKAPRLRKNEKIIPMEKAAAKSIRLSRGIYLSFLPDFTANSTDDVIEAFRVHFLNETADHLVFTYHARDASGHTLLQLNGALHPFANIFLHTLSLEALNAQPRLNWEVAPKEKPASGLNGQLRIRPAQLVRHIAALIQDGTPSFSVLLAQDAEAIPEEQQRLPKQQVLSAEASVQPQAKLQTHAERVLDLHMDTGGDSPVPADHAQIMYAQQALLQRKLEAAHVAGLEKMVVIHGIGTGALRAAVHAILKDTPFVARFTNQWLAEYGWGATEVFFQK